MLQIDYPSVSSSPVEVGKCEVCYQQSHGQHFGASTCRACAAFFRRFNVSQNQNPKCRSKNRKCGPSDNGRWYCKKCRMDRCIELGMTPDNIQLHRDLFSTNEKFVKDKKRRLMIERIPTSVEKFYGKSHLILSLYKKRDENQIYTFFDMSSLIGKLSTVLREEPKFDRQYMNKSSLERLAHGLRNVRKEQKLEDILHLRKIGRDETSKMWENDVLRAAKWFMHYDEFRKLEYYDRCTILKCIWHVFTRLERMAMTADMRYKKYCGQKQFIVSNDSLVDYENVEMELDWLTDLPNEQAKFFLGSIENWFGDSIVNTLMEMQPTDVELTFIICNLCFRLTGKKFGGQIEEITDNLQDSLANDLHNYYVHHENNPRYSHRLSKLLSINNEFALAMQKRCESVTVAAILNAFKVDFSHRELFEYSC